MTEQTNPSPAHLVRVTHPDNAELSEQVRLDVPEGESVEDAAKAWLADGRRDQRWLAGHAEIVHEQGEDQLEPEQHPEPEE